MIHPTAAQILATIQTGFEGQIVPHLSDPEARSAAATIGHLLRHVSLRIEREGQILFDDVARLRGLVGRIAEWMEDARVGDATSLRTALAKELPPELYPSLELTGELALAMRSALVGAQTQFLAASEVHGASPAYQSLHEEIRSYIADQLADEALLIEPAFLGKGPRR